MKRVPKWAAVCALLVASTALAQVPLVTVDENGHGNFNGTPLAFTIGPDPTIPTFAPTVTYVLPSQVVPGDVRIFEPAATAAIPSDLVRFVNVGNQGLLLFYSDIAESGELPDLADVGLPTNEQSNTRQFNEVGSEGNNGLMYTPGPNDPGFFVIPGTTVPAAYNLISDVPEPTLLSLSLGVLGAVSCRRRRS